MQLWRINLLPDAQKGVESAAFCIAQGVVGIGWGLAPLPASKEDYWERAKQEYVTDPENKYNGACRYGWPKAANVILYRMQIDDLVWTRDPNANYYLGRITSDWRPVDTPEYRAADIGNVRACEWKKVGAADMVPGKIVSSFARGATVQRVCDCCTSEA